MAHNMTDEQLAQWGAQEDTLRQQEMANVSSPEELKRVQAACAARRKAAGLSRGEAFRAVLIGQRIKRGESLAFALRR